MLAGLSKQSPAKTEEYIVYLSKKPIRILWEMQARVKVQQTHIFDLYVKAVKSKRYKEQEKLENQSKELHAQEMAIKKAIGRK